LRRPDEATLRCAYRDGTEPYALHHFAVKPWLEPTFYSPYARLLRRLLIRADVQVHVREGELPLRLRTGPRAWVSRTVISAYDLTRWYLRDRFGAWLRNRASGRQRRAAEGS
jgi:hypothetical protein